jgi:hypothetical protein
MLTLISIHFTLYDFSLKKSPKHMLKIVIALKKSQFVFCQYWGLNSGPCAC